MVRAAGLEVAVTRRESGPQVERELRAAHWANNRNRAIRSIPVAVAANTAAANAFPDRGAGGYLERSLPQGVPFGGGHRVAVLAVGPSISTR